MTDLVTRAKAFAEKAHTGHVRKYTGVPYITHPEAVAAIVATVPHTDEMLAAAWLHDVVEDTTATFDDIHHFFGGKVADLVAWLTELPAPGNRATRKARYRDHLAKAPAAAQTIKVADLMHNTLTIKKYAPGFYNKAYGPEKAALLKVLTKADPGLLRKARSQLKGLEA